jgi:hypothetical protein
LYYDQKRALFSSGAIFPFGVPLDVADAFFTVLLELAERISSVAWALAAYQRVFRLQKKAAAA